MNETIKMQLNHRTIRAFKTRNSLMSRRRLWKKWHVTRRQACFCSSSRWCTLRMMKTRKNPWDYGAKICRRKRRSVHFCCRSVPQQRNSSPTRKRRRRASRNRCFLAGSWRYGLAVQNFVNAAESMGLGAVILGSINNEPKELVKILNLPKMTYPVLGVQVGVPDQEPQLKPRLPLEFISFENEYPHDFSIENLASYDEVVQTYYDLRDANKRIDSFTNQIGSAKLDNRKTHRSQILEVLHEQGLCWK